ncbi:MAG: YHS domain-containing protein, partial [Pyrinomonadaceae bacterium]
MANKPTGHSQQGQVARNRPALPSGTPDAAAEPAGERVTDPVCGMQVTLGRGKPHQSYLGAEYHFCSQKCRDRFEDDPYFYSSGNAAE